MSLHKGSCENCWLPPLEGDTLCRKCKVVPLDISAWIRYHIPSPEDCSKYRKIIDANTYFGSALPQKCIHCCKYILENSSVWASAIKHFTYHISEIDLCALFAESLHKKKEAVLEYADALLKVHYNDRFTCRKIVETLVYASNGRALWILEELVQRPAAYEELLETPSRIPYHISYDFHGHLDDKDAAVKEVLTKFWNSMRESTLRRIRFRCMNYKEELIEKTWHPKRVVNWCMDTAARKELRSSWLTTHG